MLILVLTVAVLCAVSLELVTYRFHNNYEIEWVPLAGQSPGEMARDIAHTMRESHDRNAKKSNRFAG
jgi:hypothetical protein